MNMNGLLRIAVSAMAMTGIATSAQAAGDDQARRYAERYRLQAPELQAPPAKRQIQPFFSTPDTSHPSYRGLMAMRATTGRGETRDEVRLKAIYEAGQAAGIHAGLDARMTAIRELLEDNAYYLDWAYGFHMLVQSGQILPPVIIRGTGSMRKLDEQTLTTARVVYTLEADARVITEPPSWRDFLLRDLGERPRIPDGLLPSAKDEVEMWTAGIEEGWVIGYQHADALHDSQVALLTRTYVGMQTALELVMEGRLQPATLASAERGITLDASGRTLAIDDRVYRITSPASWNDPDQWLVIPRPIN